MIPSDGKLSVTGADLPELRHGFGHVVELSIHEIPGGDEEIRLRFIDLPEDGSQTLLSHQKADMDVGDLDDPDLSVLFWDLVRIDFDPLQTDVTRLKKTVHPYDQSGGQRDE